jgi:hypothetical protein
MRRASTASLASCGQRSAVRKSQSIFRFQLSDDRQVTFDLVFANELRRRDRAPRRPAGAVGEAVAPTLERYLLGPLDPRSGGVIGTGSG